MRSLEQCLPPPSWSAPQEPKYGEYYIFSQLKKSKLFIKKILIIYDNVCIDFQNSPWFSFKITNMLYDLLKHS